MQKPSEHALLEFAWGKSSPEGDFKVQLFTDSTVVFNVQGVPRDGYVVSTANVGDLKDLRNWLNRILKDR